MLDEQKKFVSACPFFLRLGPIRNSIMLPQQYQKKKEEKPTEEGGEEDTQQIQKWIEY